MAGEWPFGMAGEKLFGMAGEQLFGIIDVPNQPDAGGVCTFPGECANVLPRPAAWPGVAVFPNIGV